jgi:hypothetical protein
MRRPALAIAAMMMVGVAHAQLRVPTDVELKAAYCLKITQGSIAKMQAITAREVDAYTQGLLANNLKSAQDRLNRLQAYLSPRLTALDPGAMLLATKRGEQDSASYMDKAMPVADKCAQSCGVANATAETRERAEKCVVSCMTDDEFVGRVASCTKLDWLPS